MIITIMMMKALIYIIIIDGRINSNNNNKGNKLKNGKIVLIFLNILIMDFILIRVIGSSNKLVVDVASFIGHYLSPRKATITTTKSLMMMIVMALQMFVY